MDNIITDGLLRAMGVDAKRAIAYVPWLQAAADKYQINTPLRVVHWLAQIMIESMYLRYTREIWDGKGAQARYDTRTDLGNTPECDGDGYHNRGVGLIQTTGKTNIEATLAALGLPPDQIDLLARPEWAAMSAAYYWDSRKLNAIADSTEPTRDGIEAAVRRITKRVNGGYTHLYRRQAAFDAGMSYLANNAVGL